MVNNFGKRMYELSNCLINLGGSSFRPDKHASCRRMSGMAWHFIGTIDRSAARINDNVHLHDLLREDANEPDIMVMYCRDEKADDDYYAIYVQFPDEEIADVWKQPPYSEIKTDGKIK